MPVIQDFQVDNPNLEGDLRILNHFIEFLGPQKAVQSQFSTWYFNFRLLVIYLKNYSESSLKQ